LPNLISNSIVIFLKSDAAKRDILNRVKGYWANIEIYVKGKDFEEE
jgi:hypothetical protein